MKVDVLGCIKNTQVPLQHVFLPLFEAVVNSIHSTQDKFGADVSNRGQVDVQLHRVVQEDLPGIGRPQVASLKGVTVLDNGCGFTDRNLDSFETAYSTAKADRGGKGVGRFSWLVVFHEALVDSVFGTAEGALVCRRFAFRASQQGIEGYSEEPTTNTAQTQIKLTGIHERFIEPMRKSAEVIAEKLFEHCFNYFVLGRCPRIRLIDDISAEAPIIIDLNAKMRELADISDPVELTVGAHALRVRHVQLRHRAERRHEAHLCAHHRVVTSFPLSRISDLGPEPIRSEAGEAVVHHVFVSGSPLDESVDSTRTRLDLPDGDPLLAQSGALDLKVLREAVGAHVNARLEPVIKEERQANLERIQSHIRTVQPEYRHLIRHVPDQLQRVRWVDDPRQMDEALYKVGQAWEYEVRLREAHVEQQLIDEGADLDRMADELYKVISEVNDVGQTNLVRYVSKRRAVLRLIRRLMSVREGPALEEDIHRIVFPLRATADDVQYDEHNLWLVDETLSFYEHVASDISFFRNPVAPVDSLNRPDILAFKTGDPFQHVAIVEFKRPDRDDEDPVDQLVKYAVMLRDGGGRDIHGRMLPGISNAVRIDAYGIVTLTPRMETRLRVARGNMTKVEGQDRWYGSMPAQNLYIEVLDYRAFVRRAEQRNHAFFSKLGLG